MTLTCHLAIFLLLRQVSSNKMFLNPQLTISIFRSDRFPKEIVETVTCVILFTELVSKCLAPQKSVSDFAKRRQRRPAVRRELAQSGAALIRSAGNWTCGPAPRTFSSRRKKQTEQETRSIQIITSVIIIDHDVHCVPSSTCTLC